MSEPAEQTSAEPTNVPADKINLRLLLQSGKKAEFLFSSADTVAAVKAHVFNNWPQEWADEKVEAQDRIRILFRGRFLEDNLTLESQKLPLGQTTTMHLVPRPQAPPSGKRKCAIA